MEEEKEKYCPQCWRTMPPDLTYCPFCRVRLEIEPFRRPRLLTIAGLAATAAALISVLGGFMSLLEAHLVSLSIIWPHRTEPYLRMLYMFAIIGLFDFIGCFLGLMAGTYSWKKRRIRLTIVAITSLSFIGLLNLVALNAPYGGAYGFSSFLAWWFGVPIIILSLLSLIFIVAKQQEFK